MDDVRFQGSMVQPLRIQQTTGSNVPAQTFLGNDSVDAFHRRLNVVARRAKGITLLNYSGDKLLLRGLPEDDDPIQEWLSVLLPFPDHYPHPIALWTPSGDKSGPGGEPLLPSARPAHVAGSGSDVDLVHLRCASGVGDSDIGAQLSEQLRRRIVQGEEKFAVTLAALRTRLRLPLTRDCWPDGAPVNVL